MQEQKFQLADVEVTKVARETAITRTITDFIKLGEPYARVRFHTKDKAFNAYGTFRRAAERMDVTDKVHFHLRGCYLYFEKL